MSKKLRVQFSKVCEKGHAWFVRYSLLRALERALDDCNLTSRLRKMALKKGKVILFSIFKNIRVEKMKRDNVASRILYDAVLFPNFARIREIRTNICFSRQ